jgi:tetratricopeptide (TPR) repeat protein
MKQHERHQLKENDLAHWLTGAAQWSGGHGSLLTKLLVGVAAVAVAATGFTLYRQRSDARGQALLAEAMVALNARVVPVGASGGDGEAPAAAQLGATGSFATEEAKLNAAIPKLQAAADGAPGSPAGITARYHLAAALASVGKHAEAVAAFDTVTREAGASSLYGRMARMGRADAQARSGRVDEAIATWKELVAQAGDALPADALLRELASAYRTKGDTVQLRATLTEIVEKHPNSPYAPEARADLDELKGS